MKLAQLILFLTLAVTAGCRSVEHRTGASSWEQPISAGQSAPARIDRELSHIESKHEEITVFKPEKLAQVASQESSALDVHPVTFDGQVQQAQAEVVVPETIELPQPNDTQVVTLAELQQLAFANNPSLAAAGAAIDAAQGRWLQVGLPPNTTIGYSGQQLFSGGQAEQQGLYVGQEFVRGHKLQLNREVAAQEVRRAESLYAAQEQRVLTDVRLSYYDVLVAQRRINTTRRLIAIAEQALKLTEALLKAEEGSRVDVTRARIELQMARITHTNAKNSYHAAWSRLGAVIGIPCYEPHPLEDALESIGTEIDRCAMLEDILNRSPELAAAFAEVEGARWAIQRAEAEPIPNVDVQMVGQSDNGTGSSNANLQVTMPIPWLNRNQGGIAEAQADLFAAEHGIGRTQLNLQRRFASVYQRYANARNQVHEFKRPNGILENSQATLDSIRKGYEAGEMAYLDLISAQKTYSQANLTYIEALGEFWAAVTEIEGLLLTGSLDGTR